MKVDDNKIPLYLVEKIKMEVVKKLGVESIFKLYDKLDGVYYLNKQLKRVLAAYVIGKKFNLPLLNDDKVLLSKTLFEFENKNYSIQGIDLNDNIKIPNLNVDNFIIIGFFDNFRKYKILGYISKEDCLKYNDSTKNSNNLVAKEIFAVIKSENLKCL